MSWGPERCVTTLKTAARDTTHMHFAAFHETSWHNNKANGTNAVVFLSKGRLSKELCTFYASDFFLLPWKSLKVQPLTPLKPNPKFPLRERAAVYRIPSKLAVLGFHIDYFALFLDLIRFTSSSWSDSVLAQSFYSSKEHTQYSIRI